MERVLREATFELDDDDLEALGQRFESDDDYPEARPRSVIYSRARGGTVSMTQFNLLTRRVNIYARQIRTLQASGRKQQQKFQLVGLIILFFILRKPGGLLTSGGGIGSGLFSFDSSAIPPAAGGVVSVSAPAGNCGMLTRGELRGNIEMTDLLFIGLGLYLISDPTGPGGDDKGGWSSLLSNPIVLLLLLEILLPRPG